MNTANSNFRDLLKLKSIETQKSFRDNFSEAHQFLLEKGLELGKLRQHSAKLISAGAITGSLLLTSPININQLPAPIEISNNTLVPQEDFINALQKILPIEVRPLARDEEKKLEVIIKDLLAVNVKGTLEGEHLNTIYGYIGAEQHLKRYPGDILENHGPYFKEGIAPGLGAWGYLSRSKLELNERLVETEKWYSVVQTLYLPDWNTRQPYLRDWYKFRKLLIVNTVNGNAVITAIADAGPAAWTGKHFGGSPEVMEYLGGSRYKKGTVLVFFVDDPENKTKLGPVEYNDLDRKDLVQI